PAADAPRVALTNVARVGVVLRQRVARVGIYRIGPAKHQAHRRPVAGIEHVIDERIVATAAVVGTTGREYLGVDLHQRRGLHVAGHLAAHIDIVAVGCYSVDGHRVVPETWIRDVAIAGDRHAGEDEPARRTHLVHPVVVEVGAGELVVDEREVRVGHVRVEHRQDAALRDVHAARGVIDPVAAGEHRVGGGAVARTQVYGRGEPGWDGVAQR